MSNNVFSTESTYLTFSIAPNNTADVRVKYQPNEIEKYTSNLIIQVENNPYEKFDVTLTGEAFTKSVVFENLKLVQPILTNLERLSRESVGKKKKTFKQNGTSFIFFKN